MVTTKDNPYDPNKDFDEWYVFDTVNGYNTLAVLASMANISVEYSDERASEEWKRAENELLLLFPNLYKRIAEDPASR